MSTPNPAVIARQLFRSASLLHSARQQHPHAPPHPQHPQARSRSTAAAASLAETEVKDYHDLSGPTAWPILGSVPSYAKNRDRIHEYLVSKHCILFFVYGCYYD